MILLQNTLISEDVIDRKFICDIERCKGACCIEGDQGAPVEKDEVELIKSQLTGIAKHLSEEGQAWIDEHGFVEEDKDGDLVTTCLPDGKCCFVTEDQNGKLACSIEQAYYAGDSTFLKPISCHLYPIRISKYVEYHAVNYHQWDICSDACALGNKVGVRVYEFLEAALIRKFGADWYSELKQLAESYLATKDA